MRVPDRRMRCAHRPIRSRYTRTPVSGDRDCSRSEEHTSELQSQSNLVCRLLLEKKNTYQDTVANLHLPQLRAYYTHNDSSDDVLLNPISLSVLRCDTSQSGNQSDRRDRNVSEA